MTNELASRIDRALALAAESRLDHVRLLPGNPLGVAVRHWQHVSATLVGHDVYYYPHFNAIRGLSRGDESTLDEALAWFRENQRACSVSVSHFDSNEVLLHHMAGRGLRQSRFMTVLYGVPEPTPPLPAAEVTVRALPEAELDLFLTLWQAGATDTNQELLKPLGNAEFAEWRCYVACVASEPAGIASLHLRDGIGVMASAATLPQFRGRGCQTALLNQRLADAATAGCELVLSQADPGSQSQRNIERVGLRTAYTWVDQSVYPTNHLVTPGAQRNKGR